MTTSREEAKMLVERIVFGELEVDDPAVQRALADVPEMRAELEGMLAAQRILDATAARERALHAAASGGEGEMPAMDVPATLRGLVERHAPRRPRRRLATVLLAAAAVLVGVLWWSRSSQPPAPQPSIYLGPDKVSALACQQVDGRYRVTWRGELGRGDYYRLRVLAADDSVLVASDPLRTPEWTIAVDETTKWPARVRIEVARFLDDDRHAGAPATIEFVLSR